MKLIRPTIKLGLGNAGRNGPLGDCRTDDFGSIAIAAILKLTREAFITRAGRGQRFAGFIIDQLAVQVFVTTPHAQPRTLRVAPQFPADSIGATPTLLVNNLLFSHRTVSRFLIYFQLVVITGQNCP
jgi:hypothetical protein